MKFLCLGYHQEHKWEHMSQSEQKAMMDECFAYDDQLRKNGHFAGGDALQYARTAKTIRLKDGKVVVTDGPYAETKEQLGGILILEARDKDHAVDLMSNHPAVRFGSVFEIRPANEDINALVEARKR